jgi:ADP-heptose:LPS heptosyltransferase
MPEPQNPKHILVACTGQPADLLLALPVFQTLKTSFPQARITALIDPSGRAIVQGHPAVDHVEVTPKDEGLFKLAGRLRVVGADMFITLHPKSKLVLAAWLAKIPVRIGEKYKWHGLFQTHSVPIKRAISDRNEVEYNFELLKPLGITQFAKKIEIPLSEGEREWAKEFLGKKGIPSGMPYVIVHPGSKGKSLHWKAEKFGQLLGYLCQGKGFKVIVTVVPGEGRLISEVTAVLFSLSPEQKPVIVETGELELKQLAAICQGALCVLSGPLGPMQLAAGVGTPTVTIFSPAPEATPIRWGAWGNENTVLMPQNQFCNACQSGYCRKHDPMEALTVPEVAAAMNKYISRAVPAQ